MSWQPIETAPKDGTEVIVFTPHDGVISSSYKHGCWQKICIVNGRGVGRNDPTHWMPLPVAPEAS